MYRHVAFATAFTSYRKNEAAVIARFAEFQARIGMLHSLAKAGPPLNKVQDKLRNLYDCSIREVLEFKNAIRHQFGPGCPYCGENCTTPDIDHYLPRISYAEYSLYSWNLVPSCTQCNRIFSSSVAKGADFLYPFGDKFLKQRVLAVQFQWIGQAEFTINLKGRSNLGPAERTRIDHHISMLRLSERFANYAISEILSFRRLALKSGDLVNYLGLEAARHISVRGPNSWPSLLCDALASNQAMIAWLTRQAEASENP